MITPDRHERASELFTELVGLPATERREALHAACAGDAELLGYVERLLGGDDSASIANSASRDRERAGCELPPIFNARDGEDLVGLSAGPFVLLRVLSEGGMGIVFEAKDARLGRLVAVKVLRNAWNPGALVRRFESESRILAHLHHPGIAQVYQNGTIEDTKGRRIPYFAMELIPGARTVIEFASQAQLGVRERLELLARVCDAISHGHQRGVIHRDLKPDNLLVDGDGHPKVIDFGVAAVTNSDLTAATMHTLAGQLVGTLRYMSPEQCGGRPDDVGVQSDVYALGVIGYELVCGAAPYDLSTLTIAGAVQVIMNQPPRRPREVARGIGGDVEAILLKALAKRPQDRFQSATELGADIRRYLSGQRTTARPPTVLTRAFDWARGHPVTATAGASLAVAVVVFATLATAWRLAASKPGSLVTDGTKRRATLYSIGGRMLYDGWDSGVRNGMVHAELATRPVEFGGETVAIICFGEQSVGPQAHELAVFDTSRPRQPLWTSGVHRLDFPPGEMGHPEVAGMGLSHCVVADVLPDVPGREVVVVDHLWKFAASVIRVFDLSGRVHYQCWHDGQILGVTWLPTARVLVCAGINSEPTQNWTGRLAEYASALRPACVFALRIVDRGTGPSAWCVRAGSRFDESVLWYRLVSPAALLPLLGPVEPSLIPLGGKFADGSHAQVFVGGMIHELNLQLGPGIYVTIDADGREVYRYTDDEYKAKYRTGELPADDQFQLIDYFAPLAPPPP